MKYQLLPRLSPEEFAALEASIIQHGVLVPVEYDEDGEIIDGHHRVEICESLGLVDWPRFVRKGLSEAEKRQLSRELNVSRRHLSSEQKRQVIADQLRETPSISARAIAARLGVDHKTVSSVRASLVDGGEIPHHDEVEGRDGVRQPARKTIRTAFMPEPENRRELVRVAKDIRAEQAATRHTVRLAHLDMIAQRGEKTAPIWWQGEASGPTYPVVYADPPWKFLVHSEVTGREKSAENHYPTMDLDGICALGCPAARDAVLFLWVTDLANGLACMAAWGFAFKSFWGWNKVYPGAQTGTGYWSFDNLELLLIGTRGNPTAPLPGTQPVKCTAHPVGRHSEKPAWFAEQIERLYPGVPRLEMFCREPRPGWDAWGYEAGEEDISSASPAGETIRTAQDEAEEPSPGTGQPPVGDGSFVSPVTRKDFLDWKALSAIDDGVTVAGPVLDGMRACLYVEPDRMALTARGRALLDVLDARVSAATGPDGAVRIENETARKPAGEPAADKGDKGGDVSAGGPAFPLTWRGEGQRLLALSGEIEVGAVFIKSPPLRKHFEWRFFIGPDRTAGPSVKAKTEKAAKAAIAALWEKFHAKASPGSGGIRIASKTEQQEQSS